MVISALKFIPSETQDPQHKWNILLGLAQYLTIYDPELHDHNPVRPVVMNKSDAAIVDLSNACLLFFDIVNKINIWTPVAGWTSTRCAILFGIKEMILT